MMSQRMPICRKQVARVMKNFRSLDEGYGHHSGELLRGLRLKSVQRGFSSKTISNID